MSAAQVELVTSEVTLAGFRTRAIRTEGEPGRHPVLLLLHGYSDTADTWRRLQRRLAEAGWTSVAVDQPSHGEADVLDPGGSVREQFTAFAAAAAEAFGGGAPVVVVGNSMGGANALLLAQHHPALVSGVAVLAPAAFDHPSWFGVLDRFGARRAAGGAADVDDDGDPGEPDLPWWAPPPRVRRAIATPAMRVVAFGRPWLAPRGFLDGWRRTWGDPERRTALRSLVPRFRDEYLRAEPFDLAAVTQPVLGLFGTLDRLVLPSSGQVLADRLPDAEIVTLPGVGHMPQLEVPGRTTKHLLGLLGRVQAAGAGATS